MRWTRLGRFWHAIKLIYLFLLPARFGFLAVAILGWAFLFSAQGADILRALVEIDLGKNLSPHYLRMLGFVLATNVCALQAWYWARQILRVKPPAQVQDDDYFAVPPPPERFPRTARWVPRILGVLVYLIPLMALLRIRDSYAPEVPNDVQVPTAVGWLLFWLVLSLAAFLVFVVWRRAFLGRRKADLRQRDPWDFDRSTKIVLLLTGLAALGSFVAATLHPVGLAPVGSATLVFLTTGLWVPIGTLLVLVGLRLRFPVLSALFVWALLASPLADKNHGIRTVPPAGGATSGGEQWNDCRPDAVQQLEAWYARMAPRYAGAEVPIFIVATEGGGIRAAYWTASALTALQDRFPCFADHLFAISGVSGGSLGAAVFEALLARRMAGGAASGAAAETVCRQVDVAALSEEESLRNAAKEVLAFDALTPTLASLTQPDLAQRFLPFGFPDRERALEKSWERGWSETMGDGLFSAGMLATVQGNPRLPNLFLNGTMVETGDRIVTSNARIHPHKKANGSGAACPSRPEPGNDSALAVFRNAFDGIASLRSDLPFSAAAGMSARFTYVSPAGRLPGQDKTTIEGHVVDGGYFENSGAVTASEIVDLIGRVETAHPDLRLRPTVILIDFEDLSKVCRKDPSRCAPQPGEAPFPPVPGPYGPLPKKSEVWANEILSPLRALLNTRGARGSQAVGDIRLLVGARTRKPLEVLELRLVQRHVPLPLGWLLSERSRIEIDGAMDREGGNRWGTKAVGRILGANVSTLPPDVVTRSAESSEAQLKQDSQ